MLKQLHTDLAAVNWSAYNALEDRKDAGPTPPRTLFVFGPLWDSPPSHPTTIQTTMAYLDDAMKNFGMKYTFLTFDLQLYIVACLIKWSDQERWSCVILRPGMMHILMSFLGCIGASDGNRFQFPKSIIGNKSNSIVELESVSWCADCGI